MSVVDELGERLPCDVETALYFSASEAVTNAAKHAQASEIPVRLGREEAAVFVAIVDDGVGGACFERGSGLRGLTDRLATLAGTIDVTGRPGAGTRLVARIPLAAAAR